MMNTDEQYLFVYGTLKKNHDHPMTRLLAMHAQFYSDAWFNGKLFMLTGYPCAIPSNRPEDKVFGELYQLKQPALLLSQLDVYEECSEQYPDPKAYIRERGLVYVTTEMAIEAWIYLYNRSVSGLEQIQSGHFVV